MISSRSIDDLHPAIATRCRDHIAACEKAGITIILTCTFRDLEEQARLYAIGRTVRGNKVTNAKPGESMHNYRLAYDVVPIRYGKPVWGTLGDDGKLWEQVGSLGELQGLEWAGRWRTFCEFPHFQFTGGQPLSYFENGGTL
jgi:peptidoglycan L-alanyl-D-glutamate endopeptidase CwlK